MVPTRQPRKGNERILAARAQSRCLENAGSRAEHPAQALAQALEQAKFRKIERFPHSGVGVPVVPGVHSGFFKHGATVRGGIVPGPSAVGAAGGNLLDGHAVHGGFDDESTAAGLPVRPSLQFLQSMPSPPRNLCHRLGVDDATPIRRAMSSMVVLRVRNVSGCRRVQVRADDILMPVGSSASALETWRRARRSHG